MPKKKEKYGECIHVDTIGKIDPPDYRKNVYVLSTRDDATEYARVMPQLTKTDEETDLSWKQIYAGRPISGYRPDAGTEFRGVFEANRRNERIKKDSEPLPRRPTYHAREERWHRELHEGTRAALSQSGAPTRMWSLALTHWVYNENRRNREMTTVVRDPLTNTLVNKTKWTNPFKLVHGVEPNDEALVPFGTGCYFLNDSIPDQGRDRGLLACGERRGGLQGGGPNFGERDRKDKHNQDARRAFHTNERIPPEGNGIRAQLPVRL